LIQDSTDLLTQHVHALFTHDANGRIVSENDWQGKAAPRFYIGKTRDGIVWRVRHDISDAMERRLAAIVETEPRGLARPLHESQYLDILSAGTSNISFGPTYYFAKVSPAETDTILIDEHNAYLLASGLDDWIPDVPHRQPFVAVVENGKAVSVCASVRITDTAHEAGVETLPDYRGRGFARAAAARWAQAVDRLGALPMYSTWIENVASQRVAQSLDLVQYGVEFSVTA